jgi:magnesium transporter
MRKITAWVAILATITAIAGIYGMNFQYMPEPTGATATPRCSP